MTAPREISYKVGDVEMKLPANSGTEVLAAGIKQLQERIDKENAEKSTVEIVLDNSNEVEFPGFPYKFESLGEKVLVSIDVYKSGYECKVCKGQRKIMNKCGCEQNGHPGVRYGAEEIDAIRASFGNDIADARMNITCPECGGDYQSLHQMVDCKSCDGKGGILIIPETSKNLPTTGVVVSIGAKVDPKEFGYKRGDRILFGPYAGNMIPTKAGLMFKIIDASQAWCKIRGGEDMAAFDFIIQE